MTNSKTRKRRIAGFQLLRLAGVVLVVVILARTDMRALWAYMKQVDGTYFILAIVFQLLLLFLKALRWVLLNDFRIRTSKIFQRFGEFFESYAIGVITPGRVGELVKAGHAGTREGVLDAGLQVVVERGFDIGIFVIFAGLAMAMPVLGEIAPAWGWLVVAGGSAIILFSLIILISQGAQRFLERSFKAVRLLKKDSSLTFRQRPASNVFAVAGLSLVSNVSYFISCFFLALGTGILLPFIWVTGGVAFAGLLNMLPVTVMGLGTREMTFLYVFSDYPEAQVLALSGLVFLVAQVGGGLVSLVLGQVFLWKARRD